MYTTDDPLALWQSPGDIGKGARTSDRNKNVDKYIHVNDSLTLVIAILFMIFDENTMICLLNVFVVSKTNAAHSRANRTLSKNRDTKYCEVMYVKFVVLHIHFHNH